MVEAQEVHHVARVSDDHHLTRSFIVSASTKIHAFPDTDSPVFIKCPRLYAPGLVSFRHEACILP